MTTITISVTKIQPKYLFLLRWAVKLIGAKLKVWKAKPRKEKTI